ncbi:hypothetical protein EG329_003097 [Mollisiaceae sp. DMI_Dod_QoI]|nr:hypothetical protein EG329_003097 [Helotiales sp. DMI_Dod_QoI]
MSQSHDKLAEDSYSGEPPNDSDPGILEAKVESPPEKTRDPNIVDFSGPSDPMNPLNWPFRKKVITTLLYGLTTAGAQWASSVYSAAISPIAQEFGIGTTVSVLGLSLFLFGIGIGPTIWAPVSEAYGRKIAVLPPYFIAACFCFGTAAAKDIQTDGRFFAAAPVTNTGGALADIWEPKHRGIAILGYSMALMGGPLFSPIAGSAIVESYLSWRWVFYITGILMMALAVIDIFFIDESMAGILLSRKAARLRHETGNWALHAKHEEVGASLERFVTKYLVKPWQLLFTPICFFVVLYTSFVYGIVYLNFAAYPIEFEQVRGWSPLVGSLPFIATFIGALFGGIFVYYNNRYYIKQLQANNNKPVPEARLRPMMVGSVTMVGGLFVFAWTSSPKIHWIGSCIGAVIMGFGFFCLFQGGVTYLVDTFQMHAASALAAGTLLRSVFAGVFPLFTEKMFDALHVDWAVSVLGFISLAMLPIPFIFKIYGKRIRARGKWSKASTM